MVKNTENTKKLSKLFSTSENVSGNIVRTFEVFRTMITQSAFTISKLTIETLEKGVKYVQS